MDRDKVIVIIDGPKEQALILKQYFLGQGFQVYEEDQVYFPSAWGVYNMPLPGLAVDAQIIAALIGAAGAAVVQLIANKAAKKEKDSGEKGIELHNVQIEKKGDAIKINIGSASVGDVRELTKTIDRLLQKEEGQRDESR